MKHECVQSYSLAAIVDQQLMLGAINGRSI